jgi:hypothetical protein
MIKHKWVYIYSGSISKLRCEECELEKTTEYDDYTSKYKLTYYKDGIKQKKVGDCMSLSNIRDKKLNDLLN